MVGKASTAFLDLAARGLGLRPKLSIIWATGKAQERQPETGILKGNFLFPLGQAPIGKASQLIVGAANLIPSPKITVGETDFIGRFKRGFPNTRGHLMEGPGGAPNGSLTLKPPRFFQGFVTKLEGWDNVLGAQREYQFPNW